MKKENFKHNHKNRRRAGEVGIKTCFVTKQSFPRSEMLRFVSAPGRQIVFDVAEKLPGHGFWLKADKDLLHQAVTKRIFYKAAKGTVLIPDDLEDKVVALMKGRCLNLLSLCRKAGQLVWGAEAVKQAVSDGKVALLFRAEDASDREGQKIYRPEDPFPVYAFFGRSELGQITGIPEVVNLAVLNGTISDQIGLMARKMDLYLNGSEQKG